MTVSQTTGVTVIRPETLFFRLASLMSAVSRKDGSYSCRAKYAALSYCWGQCELLRTTEATYAERCLSIPLHTLPRTFKDAVSMTTALGLQYLWIDALCITQDSA